MINRTDLTNNFLAGTDWATAERKPLAGDASNRRYERLHDRSRHRSAVLMDAPPEKGEDVRPFVQIAQHLSNIGLSAPRIFAQDTANGFLILEDLGDDLYARVMADQPELEIPLYQAATDVLLTLHKTPLPTNIAPYSPQVMTDMAALAFDWYLTVLEGENPTVKADFYDAFLPVLMKTCATTPVLIQRDYHAENLLWLPDRTGVARVGLLDFQDAMTGHPAYDLVSLMQDARRDVSGVIETQMINRYIVASNTPRDPFVAAYHCLGAQRNLRILGVFTRLCVRDGKASYVDLIPRVWAHIMTNLAHPALGPIADFIKGTLPPPTPEILQRLKDKCATQTQMQ